MRSQRTIHKNATILAISLAIAIFVAPTHAQDSWEEDFKTGPPPGKNTFTSTCAGCHGLDGRGSERAPSIASGSKVQRLSDAQISNIISNGVPGTGMPPFHSLPPSEVRAVVSYLRMLQGKVGVRVLPGDAKRGKEVFFSKGECSSCHAFSGEGGFFGPDLSAFGSGKSAKAVLDAILNPPKIPQPGYQAAAVTTHDGTRVEGVIRNEDNFSVQLLSKDGNFHFFQKVDLQNFEYLRQSFMPANYGERLTQSELNDLVNFMITAGSAPAPMRAHEE
jgi:cytochrome c oxidase cbb3-type subunit 3